MNNKKYNILTSVQYVLGDKCLDYTEASGFSETELPDMPDMWGWGKYYQSSKDINEFEIESAEKSLNESQLDRSDITAVLFCNTASSNGCEAKSDDKKAVLDRLGLKNAYPITIQSNGCDSLLVGINMACGLLRNREAGAILVVAADKTKPDAERFKQYGIFSDSSCACIVTSHEVDGYDLLNSAFVAEVETMHEGAPFTSELASDLNHSLLNSNRYSMNDISMIFSSNLYAPISQLKEMEAGADKNQIYQGNIARTGHCYSNDPLINLSDYTKCSGDVTGKIFILLGDSPGLRTGILIQGR